MRQRAQHITAHNSKGKENRCRKAFGGELHASQPIRRGCPRNKSFASEFGRITIAAMKLPGF